MKIENIMTRNVHTLKTTSKVYEAQDIMKEHDFSFLPVLEGEKIVGIITDKDLINGQIKNKKIIETYFNLELKDIMNTSFDFVYNTDSETAVFKLLKEKHRRRVPVVDEKQNLVGIISINDLNAERMKLEN
ncbi:MAG: CBS domain-containing protein [Clostridia bacterium]